MVPLGEEPQQAAGERSGTDVIHIRKLLVTPFLAGGCHGGEAMGLSSAAQEDCLNPEAALRA